MWTGHIATGDMVLEGAVFKGLASVHQDLIHIEQNLEDHFSGYQQVLAEGDIRPWHHPRYPSRPSRPQIEPSAE